MEEKISDFKIALKCVQEDGMKLYNCSQKLQNNFSVAVLAIKNNFNAIGAVGIDLFKSKKFIDIALDLVVKNSVDTLLNKDSNKQDNTQNLNNEAQE